MTRFRVAPQGPVFFPIMPELKPILTAGEIHLLVKKIAQRISSDYQGRELVLIAVLKGAFIFLSDLIRQLSVPVKVDFLQAASYGAATKSSGQVHLAKPIGIDIKDRDVLLIEDIVDSGITLSYLLDYLRAFQPRSLEVCALLDKRERREVAVSIAYPGLVVGQGFLVGYGLDYDEDYRHLPGIYHLQL
jgi:hypoxanthine phosphoribosyltransferase